MALGLIESVVEFLLIGLFKHGLGITPLPSISHSLIKTVNTAKLSLGNYLVFNPIKCALSNVDTSPSVCIMGTDLIPRFVLEGCLGICSLIHRILSSLRLVVA
jgi:hypothetical protein